MSAPLDAIREAIARHGLARRQATAVPRLTLFHVTEPTPPVRSLYDPRLCVVVQGRKQILLGERTYDIAANEYLIATADLPVTARVTKASAGSPHLAITLDLDRARMADLLLAMPEPPSPAGPSEGLAVARAIPVIAGSGRISMRVECSLVPLRLQDSTNPRRKVQVQPRDVEVRRVEVDRVRGAPSS